METPATLPWPAFRLSGSTLRQIRGSEFAQNSQHVSRGFGPEAVRVAPLTEQRLSPWKSVLVTFGLSAMSWAFLLGIAMALYAIT